MASIYDNIKTARELITNIRLHGMSTAEEDICRIQDIFGNSTYEELADLANDIGRNDDNGKPDPNGKWSSNRAATRGTFYSTLFKVWNWEDATRFWNEHTNPEHTELKALQTERKENGEMIRELTAKNQKIEQTLKELETRFDENIFKLEDEKNRADAAELEIIKLKARLFDLIVKD